MTPELLTKIQDVVHSRQRRRVSYLEVAAVLQQESGGVSVFHSADVLLKENLEAACRITQRYRQEILSAFTITKGPLSGEICKFRIEPAYWIWAEAQPLSLMERILLSASVGLGQQMTRWLVSRQPVALWRDRIQAFMSDEDEQIDRCASILDSLLSINADRKLAYSRYNAGTKLFNPTEYGDAIDKRVRAMMLALKPREASTSPRTS